ncbi:MAG: hypothetical protein JXA30_13140 [Deltaproteobacteria bacterium]|nr:hypothetical protein [Deltaproteobacteria bacterium]
MENREMSAYRVFIDTECCAYFATEENKISKQKVGFGTVFNFEVQVTLR